MRTSLANAAACTVIGTLLFLPSIALLYVGEFSWAGAGVCQFMWLLLLFFNSGRGE